MRVRVFPKTLRVEIENETRVFPESLIFETEMRVSQKSVLGISWNIGFYYTLGVLEIRGTKMTKLLRYWYWVVLGCFRNFGIGIVKDFSKYLY